ncbi:MAG: response regulator [Candidatus Bathyarchaeota archaeon]
MTNRILLIEDEEDIRNLVHRILTSNGFEVSRASSGEEALVKMPTSKPDLIILDLMMKGLSGLEICRLLKSKESTRHIPIIVLTALSRDVDRRYAAEAGADEYLTKPFTAEALLRAVDNQFMNKPKKDEPP